MYIFEEIQQLSHEELFNLLIAYDKYVIEITNREDGSIPVCLAEFYTNDYQEINQNKCFNCGTDTKDEYNICQECDEIFCDNCFDILMDTCKKCSEKGQ